MWAKPPELRGELPRVRHRPLQTYSGISNLFGYMYVSKVGRFEGLCGWQTQADRATAAGLQVLGRDSSQCRVADGPNFFSNQTGSQAACES